MATQFTYETTELEFGNFAMCGDWTLTIDTEDQGLTFRLVDAESVRRGVDKETFALIQSWIDGDTAPRFPRASHKSLVRAAYDDHVWQHENESARYHVEPPVDLSLIGRAA